MTELLSGRRVLLVEDEAMVAMMVEDMLEDLGCVVVEVAGTVTRGLAAASNELLQIDGAILDVNLGGEKVYPVAARLAERNVPFIFSTGYGLADISTDFAHVPALAKPYERQALQKMLSQVLSAA